MVVKKQHNVLAVSGKEYQVFEWVSNWILSRATAIRLLLLGCEDVFDQKIQSVKHTAMEETVWVLLLQFLPSLLIGWRVIRHATKHVISNTIYHTIKIGGEPFCVMRLVFGVNSF